MSYINYLNLPPLPLDIEIDILNTVDDTVYNSAGSDRLINADDNLLEIIGTIDVNESTNIGYHYSKAKTFFPDLVDYDFIDPSDTVKNWILENIPFKCVPYIQVMSNGILVPPHVDEFRSKAVNYLIASGGSASTTFYKPKEEYTNLKITPQAVVPYDRLEAIESKIISEKVWHELTVTVIHGVENLSSKRISLSLCL